MAHSARATSLRWRPATYWLLGLVSAALLFGSVLVHELAHSLVAEGLGLRVRDITLFIFGGVSSITTEASKARDEFLIAGFQGLHLYKFGKGGNWSRTEIAKGDPKYFSSVEDLLWYFSFPG